MAHSLDHRQFEQEARRLRPALLRVASGMLGYATGDAEDAVQEALLKLWFFRDRLADYDSVDAPALVIVRRVSLNMLRSRGRSLTVSSSDSMPQGEWSSEEPGDEDISDELSAAIDSLPTTEQAVLRLRHIDELEIDEIAAMTDSSAGAVRTALSRARRKVRDRFLTNRDAARD